MTKNPDFKSYVSVQRWSSYWHQITEILDLQPATVLIIGCEDGIVGKFVGQYGINVSTFDLNPTLQPDYVGDVREIDKILNGKRFDVIVCCQVLEHIPYEHFEDILQKFSKLAKNVIISLPYAYSIYSITLNIPKLKLFNKRFSIHTYHFRRSKPYCGWHFWEIGYKGYASKRIRECMKKFFVVEKEYLAFFNDYHRFYILKSI